MTRLQQDIDLLKSTYKVMERAMKIENKCIRYDYMVDAFKKAREGVVFKLDDGYTFWLDYGDEGDFCQNMFDRFEDLLIELGVNLHD